MPRTMLLPMLLLPACIVEGPEPTRLLDNEIAVPPRGEVDVLDVGEWNIEWFGSTANGPSDEALQLSRARDVIAGADLDLWGVEEIVSVAQFDQLVAALPGYDGLLANDASVTDGSAFYSGGEQKVGIIFKSSAIAVRSARVILTEEDFNFAGRPPLEVALTATIDGRTLDFTFIVLHAKALGDTASYNRRVAASAALKAYLDAEHAGDPVLLLGDINDDLDTSIAGGRVSPYKNFVDDAARYTFTTKKFTDAHDHTTVRGNKAIDHHMVTNELRPLHVDGSAEIFRVDQFIPDYENTTSDHFPTLTKYRLGGPSGDARLIINEILANELGVSTAGEFIELVNIGGTAANLAGCTLSDGAQVRHTFPASTTIAPGKALVVFGGIGGIPFPVTGMPASTGGLSLDNAGDTVTLSCAGTVVDRFTYPAVLGATDGVSMNRDPDASALGSFVAHPTVGRDAASPGFRANGTAF